MVNYEITWLILILSTTSSFIPFLKTLDTLSQTTWTTRGGGKKPHTLHIE